FNISEVTPEYSVGTKRVDYSLRINNSNKVFIEVKKISEELENHQTQLLNYSFQEGVKLAVLTNGITWWFYLPLNEGSWEQRKFYSIDLLQQESENVADKFIDFLSKENVSSGQAITNAEAIYTSQKKKNIVQSTIKKAWNKIISEPDGLLVDLLNETTEKLCGYKATDEQIENFISKHINNLIISELQVQKPVSYPRREQIKKIISKSERKPFKRVRGAIKQKEYLLPILEAISEMGGRAKKREVFKIIEQKLKHKFNELDFGILSSGTVRWKKQVAFQRLRMVKEGYLRSDSPRGIWEISEKGKYYLKKHYNY
ncbi:MAG: hypothetical protein KAW92_07700, partial [Candidatus Cloacimonetes bacterium]|nr:hypothetical protein [Candidatus Cloacimonadota bacterium]